MAEAFPRGRSAIVAAETFGIGEAPGWNSMDLAVSASLRALADVGLTPGDVDALFVGTPDDALSGLTLAQYLGITPRLTDNNRTGGSSSLTHAIWAALALDAGLCDVALITYGSNQRTAAGALVSGMRPPVLEAPYGLARPVGAYALAASRYRHRFGLKREQLGAVAIAARQWAALNPEAFVREPLGMAEYLAARMVSDPLGVRDCCLVTDGAAAVVMVRAERARDLAARPAYLLGGAAATEHRDITAMPDLTRTAAVSSGRRAFAQAGLTARDVDVAELYDAFTINTLLFLEDLGFCAKGEGAAFVENGAIAPGGRLPVNTNGGGLSCVHPGMYGLFTIVEASRQLMGRAPGRQIAGADVALAHGNGGELSSQATLLLGSAATV
ncbi:MAG TPA: acetyl-CoA acetyltransferase [Burkholderiaceae bacterium]|nr:acetyl-CoA acetyltransferase [Burkholderiaceae bacterium]